MTRGFEPPHAMVAPPDPVPLNPYDPSPDATTPEHPTTWWTAASRSARFWSKATAIYGGYKLAQARAALLRASGRDPDWIAREVWEPQHAAAAADMHRLCLSLRGFYLKAGQFIGARGDFVPRAICERLSHLQDRVPPMEPAAAARLIREQLGGAPLEAAFDWVELDRPLGAASVAQVHRARLACRRRGVLARRAGLVWPRFRGLVPRDAGAADDESGACCRRLDMWRACAAAPPDAVVAVKVQYPAALEDMSSDLGNLRLLAAFLSKTEMDFDLVSAVDELADQIRLEFDFKREARVMQAVADQLQVRRWEGGSPEADFEVSADGRLTLETPLSDVSPPHAQPQ